MYEVHKDNLARIDAENKRMRGINEECLAAIDGIMAREGMNARIVFYPGYETTEGKTLGDPPSVETHSAVDGLICK